MNIVRYISILVVLVVFASCRSDEVIEQFDLDKELTDVLNNASPVNHLAYYILANEFDYQFLPNQDPRNPVTREKAELGKFIFFETGMAQNPLRDDCFETYSCSSCHIPEKGFLPGRTQGIADGAHGFGHLGSIREKLDNYSENEIDAQGTRPLTVMNVAYMTNTLWSGLFGAHGVNEGTEDVWVGKLPEINHLGYVGLESQNIEGMELHRLGVNEHVLDDYGYRELFDKAFADVPEEERYSPTTISFALGAYLRSVLTTRAPFQSWLKGDREALTERQKKGAMLFFGKARCSGCHNSPSLGSMNFHALGTKDLYEFGGLNTSENDIRNLGRGMFTGEEADFYRFKVPQLYNLKDYATYFHGSSKESLSEVLDFKIRARSENPDVPDEELSPLFQPLDLTDTEKAQLLDFLENALYDPDMQRYVPKALPSGLCFPNNDALSKIQMGCE